ncbi:hypothetical protein [Pontibacter populi]|uniref:Uncharacterized protein n=1 Tax=Pontibacter populi TaxID=890055 RepID=A0ABV1RPG2_9BACT
MYKIVNLSSRIQDLGTYKGTFLFAKHEECTALLVTIAMYNA